MRTFCILFSAALIFSGTGLQAPSLAQTTKINANDLVCNGESFFELSNIRDELTRLARADG